MVTEYSIAKTPKDISGAFALRNQVFVVEQQVPGDMELDEFDEGAAHAIAKVGDKIVGTGRLVVEGNRGRIGRVAVDRNYRGQDIGTHIMLALEEEANKKGLAEIYLHAQTHAQSFYDKLGYTPRGEKFDEAGIEHQEMYKILSKLRS